jgi:DNA-binding response OmpR family regulator
MRQLNIILVIAETSTRELFSQTLDAESHTVEVAESGEVALELLEQDYFDLLFVELEQPGMNSQPYLESVRELSPDTLVVAVAGNGKLETAVIALRAGVFDYLLMPSEVGDILACLERARVAIAEREQKRRAIQIMEEMLHYLKVTTGGVQKEEMAQGAGLGRVFLDMEKRQATLGARVLELTPTEFDLLALLVRHPDEPFSSEEILAKVKGYSGAPMGARAAVRVYMSRLRHKVEENPSDPRYLRTVRGIGYMYQEPRDG